MCHPFLPFLKRDHIGHLGDFFVEITYIQLLTMYDFRKCAQLRCRELLGEKVEKYGTIVLHFPAYGLKGLGNDEIVVKCKRPDFSYGHPLGRFAVDQPLHSSIKLDDSKISYRDYTLHMSLLGAFEPYDVTEVACAVL